MSWIKMMFQAGVFAALACGGAHAVEPAPPNAKYFTECLAAALQAKSFDRDGRYLRFACHGETAEWFFNALGRRDQDVNYEYEREGGIYRYIEPPEKDGTASNYCRRATQVAPLQKFACVLYYPAGAFLDR